MLVIIIPEFRWWFRYREWVCMVCNHAYLALWVRVCFYKESEAISLVFNHKYPSYCRLTSWVLLTVSTLRNISIRFVKMKFFYKVYKAISCVHHACQCYDAWLFTSEWTGRSSYQQSCMGRPVDIQSALKPLRKCGKIEIIILGLAVSYKMMNWPWRCLTAYFFCLEV